MESAFLRKKALTMALWRSKASRYTVITKSGPIICLQSGTTHLVDNLLYLMLARDDCSTDEVR